MRVKITFPDTEPLCQLHIPVRIGDINYGGHVGNDALLSIMQESRMQWLAQAGLTELNVGGHGMIMSDVMVAYQGESFYGDVLDVALYAVAQNPRSFDLLYRITVLRQDEVRLIAEAKSGMVCFDYENRKVVTMGNTLKSLLGL
ncbi:MAG: thioesterase family protein [Bacteroidetes bacterium]|nr:thioesterase family protein [Bacteroidota bacterium]MBS1630584.1 thioesterase family protein [Bacteroidota bacterium]